MLARVGTVGLAVLASAVVGASPALAHESIEEGLARGGLPPTWVYAAGAWAALTVMLAVAALVVYRRLRPGSRAGLPRWWTALGLVLPGWLLLGFLQSVTAREAMGTPTGLYLPGTAVFLLALTAIWAFVAANAGPALRLVLAYRSYRWARGVRRHPG